jgi:DNA repair protein RadC
MMPFKTSEQHRHYTVDRAVSDTEIVTFAQQIIARKFRRGSSLCSPDETRRYFMLKLAELEYEVFCVLFLDNKNQVLKFEEMFRGTHNSANVYPREVVKQALFHNASAVVLVHNHPSGVPDPSMADRRITQRLIDALDLVDVKVLDHFIVAGEQSISFAERGLL